VATPPSETAFAQDMLSEDVPGPSAADTRQYLEFVVDQQLLRPGKPQPFGAPNSYGFMELRHVPEFTNFFGPTVSTLHLGPEGAVPLGGKS
jgi:ribonucleoside-diphosphate reductase beta chain